MATSTETLRQGGVSGSRLVIAGLIASIVMGMWQMVVEELFGAGFWSPVVYIAATVLRNLQTLGTNPGFQLVPVVLGLMGHMMNSVILGAVFYGFARRRDWATLPAFIAGMVYGVIVFVLMWYVIVPLVDPVMLELNDGLFFIAHLMYGGVLGLLFNWAKTG